MMEWADQAACLAAVRAGEADTSWWFPVYMEDRTKLHAAKLICGSCPVIFECAAHATKVGEVGLWGGVVRSTDTRWKDVAEQLVTCLECERWFSITARTRQRDYCPECAAARNRKRNTDWVRVNRKSTGAHPRATVENGHGLISRYNGGCRCTACKKAARDKRALARAAAAESFRDDEVA